MANLDLSALDIDTSAPIASGKALRAPHDMFIPDPDQLERERDEDADNRDREDIKQRGVISPIIVGDPELDGRMHIRVGHRRWRLSKEAGLPDVPYMFEIDGVVYDDFAKLAENRNRKNESPMDIAKLIAKGKSEGKKNKEIADRISMDPSEITHHLVLVEGPDYIRALYHEKKCRTPKYLYELEKLAREFPAQVQEFCRNSDEFSYKAIMAFAASLKNLGNTKESSSDTPLPTLAPAASDVTAQNESRSAAPPSAPLAAAGALSAASSEKSAADGANPVEPRVSHVPSHDRQIEGQGKASPPDPTKIKKPLLLGTYQGKDVMVMLYTRPTTPGLVHVKYEDGSGEEEIEFGQVTNLTLTESRV